MATTLSHPPTERAVPDPRKHPLLALKTILRIYLTRGGPAWLRAPEGFSPLANVVLYTHYFISEGYVSTLLCYLLLGFLLMTVITRRKPCRKNGSGQAGFSSWVLTHCLLEMSKI